MQFNRSDNFFKRWQFFLPPKKEVSKSFSGYPIFDRNLEKRKVFFLLGRGFQESVEKVLTGLLLLSKMKFMVEERFSFSFTFSKMFHFFHPPLSSLPFDTYLRSCFTHYFLNIRQFCFCFRAFFLSYFPDREKTNRFWCFSLFSLCNPSEFRGFC